MAKNVVPFDGRYLPFVQQPYCCVPTCVQMVLYKNGLKLLSQEEIGKELGLVVPPEAAKSFYNVETSERPPVESGFGTRIQNAEFSLEKLIKEQNWPFHFEPLLSSKFQTAKDLIERLQKDEAKDNDVLVCFQNDSGYGHVCVFDRVLGEEIRLMNPSPEAPKWHIMNAEELFDRIQKHGDENFGGIWEFSKV